MLTPGGVSPSLESKALGVALAGLSIFIASPVASLISRIRVSCFGGPETLARKRILRFLAQHPTWNVWVYRTPCGLRLLVTHRRLAPADALVKAFFDAVGADPVYVRMCLNQQCFRARLTAKPWRIGLPGHMKPRPGLWPVQPERIQERSNWITAYEAQAAGFASCRFVESLGSGSIHPLVAPVVVLHDDASRAVVNGSSIA